MARDPGFLDYVKAAFNARPIGMFVAPNWIGLAAGGLLGLLNPGYLVITAGLELGYLLLLSTNKRFQKLVDARHMSGSRGAWDERLAQSLNRLSPRDRQRYVSFADRCRSIIDLQLHGQQSMPAGLEAQGESLHRLSWMYLRLLVARAVIENVIGPVDGESAHDIAARQSALERQLRDERLDAELRRSLTSQLEILRQRASQRAEAGRKLPYIDAELARVEQQVELIREQAALSTDPESLSQRIDEIAATLSGTSQWIRDQQQVFGAMEDLMVESPPMAPAGRARESQ
ncbi:MAG TPA: hypothetical protein VFO19_02350 [Vicinamibacterales bacterium]|nr:hypothetical protein [Vicinamibacterales bacterium]